MRSVIKKLYSFFRVIRNHGFRFILKLFIINILMLIDKTIGKKTVIIYIEELGFIQYLLPIIEVLHCKALPISYYIATDYRSYEDEISPFQVPKIKMFESDDIRHA